MINTKSDQFGIILLVLIILAIWDYQYALWSIGIFVCIVAAIYAIHFICDFIDWLHKPKKK
jgi:hypothetical protein